MECLYAENIFDEKNSITIENSEFKHVKALRLKEKDKILITDGKGRTCLSEFFRFNKTNAEFLVLERYENLYENHFKMGLAMSVLDSRDRFEFAIEKAVELGVNEIIPIYSKFSQKFKIKASRMDAKVLAALKQSKRSVLPVVRDFLKFDKLQSLASDYDQVIIFDDTGKRPAAEELGDSILLIIGPEGGFTEQEIELVEKLPNGLKWDLGHRRLRAETAAITAMSIINQFKR